MYCTKHISRRRLKQPYLHIEASHGSKLTYHTRSPYGYTCTAFYQLKSTKSLLIFFNYILSFICPNLCELNNHKNKKDTKEKKQNFSPIPITSIAEYIGMNTKNITPHGIYHLINMSNFKLGENSDKKESRAGQYQIIQIE